MYHIGHIGMHYISDPGSVKGAWRLGGGGFNDKTEQV